MLSVVCFVCLWLVGGFLVYLGVLVDLGGCIVIWGWCYYGFCFAFVCSLFMVGLGFMVVTLGCDLWLLWFWYVGLRSHWLLMIELVAVAVVNSVVLFYVI